MRIGISLLLLFFAAAKANAGIRVTCKLVPGQCAGGPDAELNAMNESFDGMQTLQHNRECIKERETDIRGLNNYGCTAHTN